MHHALKTLLIPPLLLLCVPAMASNPTNPQPKAHRVIKYPWSIGVAGIYSMTANKNTKNTHLIIPIIGYRGDRLTFNTLSIAYKFVKLPQFSLEGQAYLYPEKFDPKDTTDPKLKTLDKRKYSLLGGLKATYNISRLQNISLALSRGFIGAKNGYVTTGQYLFTLPIFTNNSVIFITPGIGLAWQNKTLLKYYYGINNAEAKKSTLNAYNPSAAFSPMASLSFTYIYQKHWSGFASVSTTRLANSIYNSPMVGKRFITTGIVVLSYLF